MLNIDGLVIGRQEKPIGNTHHHPLSFRLSAGHGLLLEGENGSGKTTLLHTLAGICPVLSPASFKVDVPCFLLSAEFSLKPYLTVWENISLQARLYGNDTHQAEALLKEAGLYPFVKRRSNQLSHGQKQRLALACTKISQRTLWLLDEPEQGLDSQGIELLKLWLQQHFSDGGMAVIASHHPHLYPDFSRLSIGNKKHD
ncbi:MAG: ABC transporter ATP-binding protein [Alphaproteobacteria bacterium]